MASPFKIPKKKVPAGPDSAHLHLSPLSRLQSSAPQIKGYGEQSGRGGADRMHAGNSRGASTDRRRSSCKPLFRDVVKTLLGLNGPNRGGASAANHRPPASWSRQSQSSSSCFLNGWRPKRASDRLQQPEEATSQRPSPPQKKKCAEPSVFRGGPAASSSSNNGVSIESLDLLAELRADEHAGSLSSPAPRDKTWRRVASHRDAAEGKSHTGSPPGTPLKQQKKNSSSSSSSEDDFVSPSRTTVRPAAGKTSSDVHRPSSSSSVSTVKVDRRRSLDSTALLAASSPLKDDAREKARERWSQFRDRKRRPAVLHRRARKPERTPTEPIVLSSEEDGEEGEDGAKRTPPSSSRVDESRRGPPEKVRPRPPPPSFLQLEFASLHAGLMDADANGKMMVTESGITVPLRGVEEGEVTVVASQVRGYGVWDGGVAQGGTLLASWEGPAPSLLFLWVTDAQASLLNKELSAIQTTTGPSCSFLLLVLKEQLQELQAALLASLLDMDEYRLGCSSSSGGPASPLDWADGLLLLHSCPPPLDQHLLGLLGHSAKSSQQNGGQRNKSSLSSIGLQQLPTRLIQYPVAPCKGRITVTKEDLACLESGQFLNDVIIDFYLKYLLLEGVSSAVAERSHVFSSFFYKQLSRRRAAGEDDAPSVPDRHMRHQRVKTWTRHVDIFTKDFLFVPVNQEAHWFLVVVCFPGLDQVRYEDFQSRAGRPAGKQNFSLRSQQPPECSEQGWQRDSVMKRPCILVMDSLKLSYHDHVCRLIRDYLQVEWEVRRRTPRLFTPDSMRSSNCRVPQQDNSSDCGLYLLQYVESFLQNPVVHFDLPLRLDGWFPRQRVRQKREEIRSLIMRLHESQLTNGESKTAAS